MKYYNIINELFSKFPMLKSVCESEEDYDCIENLPHLVYPIVFVPFIIQTVLENDENMIKSICEFLECMETSDDKKMPELLAVSVLETMLGERKIIALLKPYMKEKTLEILSALEDAYGWT